MIITILVLLLLLSVLVLIHEFGHFIMAKKFGIKVEEFGFGFPPRVFGIKKGETLYSINLLPIGGFVKLYGEDEVGAGKLKIESGELRVNKKDLDRAFFARPAWQKATVVVAGVVMNTILAAVIFYIFLALSNFKTELPLLDENYKFSFVNQTNYNIKNSKMVINAISPNSPADKAGMKAPVKIVTVNGKTINDSESFRTIINQNKGKELIIEWEEIESGKRMTATITPRISPPKDEGPLGVGFIPVVELSYESIPQRIASGIIHPFNLMGYNLFVMKSLVASSFANKTFEPVKESVSGPIGIASLIGIIVGLGDLKEVIIQLLNLAGLLSISLAFFNILPIPALDGGRLFFILIEMVSGKKVNSRYETFAHAVGFALLIGLIILVSINDISRYILGR